MKCIFKIGLLAAIILISTVSADAQRFSSRKKYWSVGGSINAMNYVGDITRSKSRLSVPFKFTRQNIGICAVRRMTPRISGRANFFYGRMKSDDRAFPQVPPGSQEWGRYERGAKFVNNVYEFSVTAIFDFYENRGTWQRRPDYTPYAFLGLGVFYHNPKTEAGGVAFKSLPHMGKGWSTIQGAFLYGVGFRYKLDKRLDLALEIGWRITTTDMLDGVDGEMWQNTDGWDPSEVAIYDGTRDFYETRTGYQYATDVSVPLGDYGYTYKEANEIGGVRGDPPNDGYIITGLHLTRIIGGGVKCPKFR